MLEGYRIGFHVSIAGGIANSAVNAKELGCSALQIFTRSPRQWETTPLAADDVKLFSHRLSEAKIEKQSTAVHMPYLPNLATSNQQLRDKSIRVLAQELQRCATLRIPYLIVHLGNHSSSGTLSDGINQLIAAVIDARDKSNLPKSSDTTVLLENSAGQKNSVGSKFEDLRLILDGLENSLKVGVCLDTCHLFASGYNIATDKGVDQVIKSLADIIGLEALKWIHLNDSKDPLGSHRDRHEHVGQGKIGLVGIRAILKSKMARSAPIIMETPKKENNDDRKNMETDLGILQGR
jgi:deoxyribonuclease-4